MKRFEHRIAIVTGAAQGIGFSTAARIAEEGASVAVLDLDEATAREAAGTAVQRSVDRSRTTARLIGAGDE